VRISFGQYEQSALSGAAQEDKAKLFATLRLPPLTRKAADRCRHGGFEVGARLKPRAFEHLPLQPEEHAESRRAGLRIDLMTVPTHRAIFASAPRLRQSSTRASRLLYWLIQAVAT
jgi:hypothetical protein